MLHTDYERISGRARTTVIYDWYRRGYRPVQLVDIGRGDGVPPADPDAQLAPERDSRQGKAPEQLALLRRYMDEHGSMTYDEMGELLGLSNIRTFMDRHSDRFECVGKLNYGVKLWRLR